MLNDFFVRLNVNVYFKCNFITLKNGKTKTKYGKIK